MTKRPDPEGMSREEAARICADFLGLPVACMARVKTASLLKGAITASLNKRVHDLRAVHFDMLHGRAKGRA